MCTGTLAPAYQTPALSGPGILFLRTKASRMARHRKIDVRMWGDSKFRSLSSPQPNAQTLWIYLLTGPHTTSVPGLFHVGEATLAESLGWPLKALREAFAEVLSKGMAEADFLARVIWIPKAIFYNRPESKNVVKSWRAYWDEIPECELKVKAHKYIKAFLEGLGEGWSSVFSDVCENPSPYQEQEQEQEQDNPPTPQGDLFDEFWAIFPAGRKQGKEAARKAWKAALRKCDPRTIIDAAAEYAASPTGRGKFVKGPVPWLNQGCWEDDRTAWQRSDESEKNGQANGALFPDPVKIAAEKVRKTKEDLDRTFGRNTSDRTDSQTPGHGQNT